MLEGNGWKRVPSGYDRSTAAELSDAQMRAELERTWHFVLDTVLEENEGVLWDRLFIEIWYNTGRFIFHPTDRTGYRIEKSDCCFRFSKLEETFD